MSDRSSDADDLRGSGVLMGRIAGIPIFVTPTWLLVAVAITLSFAPSEQRLPGLGDWRYAVSFAFAVLLYLSVLVHELSHSLTALALGLRVRRITLHLLGGASEIAQEPRTPGAEFLIAFAGPAVSLVLAGVGYVAAQALDPAAVAGFLVLLLAGANLLLGIFNLLPALPLDGGRLLAAGVWKLAGRRLTGVLIAAAAGRVLAVLLLALPLLGLLRGGRPDPFS
ncbi:MAG: M50 family metallopeptidase, partial [Actinomycetota bacterium]|nr:M50 family metallopeptidase [Actinomycetota bacterium]